MQNTFWQTSGGCICGKKAASTHGGSCTAGKQPLHRQSLAWGESTNSTNPTDQKKDAIDPTYDKVSDVVES